MARFSFTKAAMVTLAVAVMSVHAIPAGARDDTCTSVTLHGNPGAPVSPLSSSTRSVKLPSIAPRDVEAADSDSSDSDSDSDDDDKPPKLGRRDDGRPCINCELICGQGPKEFYNEGACKTTCRGAEDDAHECLNKEQRYYLMRNVYADKFNEWYKLGWKNKKKQMKRIHPEIFDRHYHKYTHKPPQAKSGGGQQTSSKKDVLQHRPSKTGAGQDNASQTDSGKNIHI